MRRFAQPLPTGREHITALTAALDALGTDLDRLDHWATGLHAVLARGGRLLTCGNGGSAAEAQHLTAELVGRFRDDRPAFSAIPLCAESAAYTAIANDYGHAEVFARQVRAHGRAGDVLIAISTSGRSENVLRAVHAAAECEMHTWALTGRAPNPLAASVDDAVCVDAAGTATVQEVHLVAIHVLCAAFDTALSAPRPLIEETA